MTDFGRREGVGDMLKAVYDPILAAMAALLAEHHGAHQSLGDDEISVAGLLGELAAAQPSTWAKVAGKPSAFAPSAHKVSHQIAGDDQINAAGLLGRINYVDRGDPSAYDFDQDDIDGDNNPHDLDLSSFLPAGAKAVHLYVLLEIAGVGQRISFRKKGTTNNVNILELRTQVAWVEYSISGFCAVDANRIVTYVCDDLSGATLSICIRGWLI